MAVNVVNGVIDAIALNNLWERYHGPGFEQKLIHLGTRADGYEVNFGYDDLYQTLIFGAEAGLGMVLKNRDLTARGLGGVVGTVGTKVLEFTNHEPPANSKKRLNREIQEAMA